jgi:hypothetical protein
MATALRRIFRKAVLLVGAIFYRMRCSQVQYAPKWGVLSMVQQASTSFLKIFLSVHGFFCGWRV